MVTMVGMQKDFGDAMKELLELEYDALAAYDESIERLENADFAFGGQKRTKCLWITFT